MANDSFNVPTDAFVEVLLHLPMSARRRFHLVCKRWRDVIDEHTLKRQVRTKILTFTTQEPISRALDDKHPVVRIIRHQPTVRFLSK